MWAANRPQSITAKTWINLEWHAFIDLPAAGEPLAPRHSGLFEMIEAPWNYFAFHLSKFILSPRSWDGKIVCPYPMNLIVRDEAFTADDLEWKVCRGLMARYTLAGGSRTDPAAGASCVWICIECVMRSTDTVCDPVFGNFHNAINCITHSVTIQATLKLLLFAPERL